MQFAVVLLAVVLQGTVVNDGVPLPGVTVRVVSPTHQYLAMTDEEGRYEFRHVAEGTYEVSFELPGLDTVTHRVDVKGGMKVPPVEMKVSQPSEPFILTCGSPCDGPPITKWDRPACADYQLHSALLESAARGDASAITLLHRRFHSELSLSEKHRIAAGLLGKVADDRALWDELHQHAAIAVRFRQSAPEFEAYCQERALDPGNVWGAAFTALDLIRGDRRSRALLLEALKTSEDFVVLTAIAGLGDQQDHAALPAIEKALAQPDRDAAWLAEALAFFRSYEADALAFRYLEECRRDTYREIRQERTRP